MPEERLIIRPVSRDMGDGVVSRRVPWVCPTCGEPRGEPTTKNLDPCARPKYMQRRVHVWENPCGHDDPELRRYAERD